jgi:hypothetical protein
MIDNLRMLQKKYKIFHSNYYMSNDLIVIHSIICSSQRWTEALGARGASDRAALGTSGVGSTGSAGSADPPLFGARGQAGSGPPNFR